MRYSVTSRVLAVAAIVAAVAFSAMPVFSASRLGEMKLVNVGTGGLISEDLAPINWTWKTGDRVKSTSKIAVQYTTTGIGWRYVSKYQRIADGAVTWDTTNLDDGSYTIRAVVWSAKAVESFYTPVLIDRKAPEATIIEPRRSQITVDGSSPLPFAVIVGDGKFAATITDEGAGVDPDSIVWTIDGTVIGTTPEFTFGFSDFAPGRYTVELNAKDHAGNEAEKQTVEIVWLPGGVGAPDPGDLPEPPEGVEPPDPNELPEPPDPGEQPDPSELLPFDPNDPQVPPELQELLDNPPDPSDPQIPPELQELLDQIPQPPQ